MSLDNQFLLRQFRKAVLDRWLTPEQLLRSADVNQDGSIDLLEFSDFLKSLNLDLGSEASFKKLFGSFDHSGDGLIDLLEVSTALGSIPGLWRASFDSGAK